MRVFEIDKIAILLSPIDVSRDVESFSRLICPLSMILSRILVKQCLSGLVEFKVRTPGQGVPRKLPWVPTGAVLGDRNFHTFRTILGIFCTF